MFLQLNIPNSFALDAYITMILWYYTNPHDYIYIRSLIGVLCRI